MESSLIGKALDFGSREYGFESHVSNTITRINALAHLMNHFNIATAQKSLYFDVHITRRSLQLLHLLYDLNMVRTYKKRSLNFYRVYPTYTLHRAKTRVIRTYFRSDHYLTIPLNLLRVANVNRPFSYIVLETDRGILTHKEALKFKLSGRLIMHID